MTIQEVNDLEEWFKNVELPKPPVMLFPGTKIADVNTFLEIQFAPLKVDLNSKSNAPVYIV